MTESIQQAAERRTNSELVITLLNQMISSQDKLDAKLTAHMLDETKEIAAAVSSILKAFPGDDPDGHRKHHELVIKQAEASAAFWEKMRFELVRWGLIGFLGWAAYALWHSFLQGPPK